MKKNSDLTRQKIITAFLNLYENRRIDKISIGDLAKEAGIYRGTFYYYYKDIYDLLEQLEHKFIKEISQIADQVMDGIYSHNITDKVPLLNEYYNSHTQIIHLFLIQKPNPFVLKQMKENGKCAALARLHISANQLSATSRYIMEYISSAQLGLFTMWIENRQEITPDALAEIIQSVNTSGALSCLMKETLS